jgi:alkylhydroperoxidase family enzyme
MMVVSYDDARVPIRKDLLDAHQCAWQHIASPGTWLTGATRVAIALESRNARQCEFCAERKVSFMPYGVMGSHETVTDLPVPQVELIHRLATDSARLKRSWCRELIDNGLSEEEYVETVSVACTTISLDTFAHAVGMPPRRIPVAVDGAPARVRPPEARQGDAWVSWIAPDDASEADSEIFGPSASNIRRALSLVPDEAREFFDLNSSQYLTAAQMKDFGTPFRAITRVQIELIAGRISAINQCAY